MRYIPFDYIDLPPEWSAKAAKARAELSLLTTHAERKKYLDDNAKIWQDLKNKLSELSHGKCWYCESIRHRSDDHVDHFRPKNRVIECKQHDGYWWLAFDWDNYRFSCAFCNSLHGKSGEENSGGKADHFPLLNEEVRVHKAGSVDDEIPLLLDPTNSFDCTLLRFIRDGRVVPQYDEDENLLCFRKAEVSIAIYNLGYRATVDRRKMLFDTLKRLVHDGRRYFCRLQRGRELNSARDGLNGVMRSLLACLNENAEFSVAARQYLEDLQGEDTWLKALLHAR